MREVLATLAMMVARLPEIKQALGEAGWPVFAEQMCSRATSFQNVEDESALTDAAEQLLRLFMADARVRAIMLRYNPADDDPLAFVLTPSERRHPSNSQPPPEYVKLDTVANRFFLLCERADLIASGVKLAEIDARASAQPAAEPVHSNAEPGSSADRIERQQV